MECYDVGDSLHGYRIRAEARKISDPKVIAKTGRHKAKTLILTENAERDYRKKTRMDTRTLTIKDRELYLNPSDIIR